MTTETEKHRQSLARLHQLHQASPQLGTQRFHRQVTSMFCFLSPFFVFFLQSLSKPVSFCQVSLLDFVKLFNQCFSIKFFFKCFFFKIIHSRRSSFIKICFEFLFRVLFICLFTMFFSRFVLYQHFSKSHSFPHQLVSSRLFVFIFSCKNFRQYFYPVFSSICFPSFKFL